MNRPAERGIALVLALFLMAALSVMGASLMFLSQTETYASMNYRTMSQARYSAESGVNKAANFLLDAAQYPLPTPVGGADPVTAYDLTKSPVQYNGADVILVAGTFPGITANYPVAAVQTAYSTAGQGTLAAGSTTATYTSYAKLIYMQVFDSYGGTQDVAQTWEITSDGGIANSRATVEVGATISTPKASANTMAAFATANTCDAVYFHGNVTVDSYDSSAGTPAATAETTGGDVGSNGNIHILGSVSVQGNVYTPRTGVGTCAAGAVTGLTEGGSATVTGSMVQLPTAVVYPAPVFSVVPPLNTTVTLDAAEFAKAPATICSDLGLTLNTNCTVSGTIINVGNTSGAVGSVADITLPNVVVASGYTLQFAGANTPGQNVNINSLTGTGSVEINANTTGNNNQSVVLKVYGKAADGTTDLAVPFDLSQMSWKQNALTTTYDASSLQIVYNGTATISMKGGNSQSAATIYAPNAAFHLQGTQDLYGSILAKTIDNAGNASIHYDRRLSHDFWVRGNPLVGTFTWKSF